METTEKNKWEAFSQISKKEWLEKIRKDLKGRDIHDLDIKISDLVISPFAHSDDFSEPPCPVKTGKGNWSIGEFFFVQDNDFKTANERILHSLMRGVQSPVICSEAFPNAEHLEILLSDVELDFVALHFSEKAASKNTELFLKTFYDYALSLNKNPEKLIGSVRFEPVEYGPNDINLTLNALIFGKKFLPQFKIICVNARRFFGEADNIVNELTQTLLACNKYFSELTDLGSTPEDIAGRLMISCNIGKNYFMEIAKLRALRILWQHLLSGYMDIKTGKTATQTRNKLTIEVHIQPQQTVDNLHKNKISAATQIMSAVIGGADYICTEIETTSNQNGTEAFNQRILTNVQHLLALESYFDRVADPLAGSYYVETLTHKIAETVWENFKKLSK